jgi:hypothetical protein
MNKLLIVTDLGLFKAFRVGDTPRNTLHLQPLQEIVLEQAHRRFDETVTDMAGRRAGPTHHGWGAPVADDHNLRLENERRLIKQIARHITEVIQKNPQNGVWLAADREIDHAVIGELPPDVRGQIEKNLQCDLTKSPEKELLDRFHENKK